MTDLDPSLRMLDTYASVGATHFDLTQTNIDGEKRGFRPQQSLARLIPETTARLMEVSSKAKENGPRYAALTAQNAAAAVERKGQKTGRG